MDLLESVATTTELSASVELENAQFMRLNSRIDWSTHLVDVAPTNRDSTLHSTILLLAPLADDAEDTNARLSVLSAA